MKSTLLIIAFIFTMLFQGAGQVPQKFFYQAVLRNADGTVIASQPVNVKITLRKAASNGDIVYTETISQNTSAQGVVSLSIGGGDAVSFAAIPWVENIFIQVEAKKSSETSFVDLGTTQILSVPYAIAAGSVKEVKSQSSADDAIFEVKNSNGEVVFGVYQNGVRMYVDNVVSKGSKGGFAVGGLTAKGAEGDFYLQITPDSARINIKQAKGSKGGFAVGGLTAKSNSEFFKVTSDTSYFKTTLFTESNIVSTGIIRTGVGTSSLALTDIEGNTYKSIKIGDQIWMQENLKSTKYNDGTPLSTLNEVAVYDLKPDGGDTAKFYGRLYAYEVVTSGKNVCPTGWHLPTEDDWKKLLNFVGGADWSNNRIITGLKMMESGTIVEGNGYWNIQKNLADNSSGFSARPGGAAFYSAGWSGFFGLGQTATWWGLVNPTTPKSYSIDGNTYEINDGGEAASGNAYSIRCIKD